MGVDAFSIRAPRRERSSDPLWSQASDAILEQIESQELTAGAKLPPERELCAQLDISRVTLRKALSHLVDQGILTASHGRGWFVAQPVAAREWPNDLESFTTTAHRKHMRPSSLVLRQTVEAASLDEADRLGVPAGTPLLHLERVRLLNDVRIAVDRTIIAAALVPALATADFGSASLFEALRAQGIELSRSMATIEARSADKELADRLEIEPGAPVLVLDQTIHAPDQRPLLASTVEYSGERYRLRTTLASSNDAPRR
ncbi:GntR family transcriptional regulator [Streptomyces sp. NPDC087420]|uniref:GntR family transcriptional regulator n=1 Tax=Streptomyces sp. NPDC087420 TaxID=3365785 RepID=UPI003833AA48